jgi:pentose-5-phosphate-3-epimerase
VKEAALLFEYVAVDGGVNDQTATKLVAAGTQQLVVGSFLQKGNIDENIEKIWEVTR